jgi:DNA-directed RNA polymerase specialized sigma24 family protein
MNKIERTELDRLIPLWNNQDRTAINRVAAIIDPWVLKIAEMQVCKKHKQIEIMSNLNLNTAHLLVDGQSIRQIVGESFAKFQQQGNKLTTAVALNQMMRTMTHHAFVNKLKSQDVLGRVSASPKEIIDHIDDSHDIGVSSEKDAMVFLLNRVAELGESDPDKAMCYAMNKLELVDTATIAEIMNLNIRTVQRHIKLFSIDLEIHFQEFLEK